MKGTLTLLGRVLVAVASTFVTHFLVFLLCWAFREPLFGMIAEAMSMAGIEAALATPPSFGAFLNVAFFAALLAASPIIIVLWLFFLIGPDTWGNRVLYLLGSLGLACLGTALGYFLLFPAVAAITEWGAARGLFPAESMLALLLWVVVGSALAFEIVPAILALRIWRTPAGINVEQ